MSRAPESPSVSSVPAAAEAARPVGALAPGRGSAAGELTSRKPRKRKNRSAESKAKRAAYDRAWLQLHPGYMETYREKRRAAINGKRSKRAEQIRQAYRDLLAAKSQAALNKTVSRDAGAGGASKPIDG